MTKAPKTKTFETPSGPVTATTQTVEPVRQEVVAVSAAQVMKFEDLALQSWDFAATYLGHELSLSLKRLDKAFKAWQLETSQRFSSQQVVQILGAYLGQGLSADLDMQWVTVTDEYGTDYAVRSRRWEVLSFPFAAVSKRIENSQCDFLVAVYHAVDYMLKNDDHMPRKA